MNLKQKLMQKSADTRTKHKGQAANLSLLLTVGVIFVLVAVVFAIGGVVLGEVDDQTTNANATTIIGEGQTALVDLSGWLPIIGVVVAATIIIGLLLAGFGRFSGGI